MSFVVKFRLNRGLHENLIAAHDYKMNTSSVIFFITKSGHLIGLSGAVVCLFLFYLQMIRLFVPRFSGWSAFRIERLFGLAQRFLWLAWLSGVSLLVILFEASPGVARAPILGDKIVILLVLSVSMIGLDGLVKRLFLSIEGGRELISQGNQSIWFKACFALSVGGWAATLFLGYCYYKQQYSQGWMVVIAVIAFSIVFAILLGINDSWVNLRSRRESLVQLK